MESITITVSPDIAQAYNRADATQQAQLQQLITAFFSQTSSQTSIDDPLGEIIYNLQTQAAANGLTQEILDDILRDV
ncbi:hypothetical protein [[Limnothrix rosea] IAM M-220]|uniref:hypothetical protein n=1 Tax=[Limnothrix rosea] IAM M-220 TaxID=454133 RepID=UPI000962AB13|nr:hypothetical protein [[Limnothrix rosea] IAM M-220]OKH10929.1 hypothetical protein NIES208_18020 [[Limnothrix rosea] IAM M-220]